SELRPAGRFPEIEGDERRGLVRIIDAGLDRVRVPAEGQTLHRFDALDEEIEGLPLVRLLLLRDLRVDGGRHDLRLEALARDERPLERHAEPAAERLRIADRMPDACDRRVQQDLLDDALATRCHSRSYLRLT